MPKRPSLFAVKSAVASEDPPDVAVAEPVRAAPVTQRAASRAGKRVLSVYLDQLAWKQLRLLALDGGTTTQALGEEAINLLFEKHRLNRSA